MNLPAGYTRPAGHGFATVLPDMDFETYSEAGYVWSEGGKKWVALKGATKKSINAVGAAVYTEHPSTEVLKLAYNLKDGTGPHLWLPGDLPPLRLFNHLTTGGVIEAWNCEFEWFLWVNVCVARMGWPAFHLNQMRDAMAKARAWGLPGKLELAADVSGAAVTKMAEGKRLINLFSVPRNPTKANSRLRNYPEDHAEDDALFNKYVLRDIGAESSVSMLCPDLSPEELRFWQLTLKTNTDGIQLDVESITAGVAILDQALEKYNAELDRITFGAVVKATQTEKMRGWLGAYGIRTSSLDAEAVEKLVARTDLAPGPRRVLEIRQLVGSAGVKKLYAMQRMTGRAGRAYGLLAYHAARTGRDGGQDIQPQNLLKAGPAVYWCPACQKPYGAHRTSCAFCFAPAPLEPKDWSWHAVPYAIEAIRTGDLSVVEYIFGDAVLLLGGCLRGLFIAAPGHDLVASDYSSIEAVVTAILAGEKWRIDAFTRKEDIYYITAGRVTGKSLEWYLDYKKANGHHHPDRQKYGKPGELGLGFGGWIMAWYQFDKTGNFDEQTVKNLILAWRAASPAVVELWGGQVRGKPWDPDYAELHGLEGAAIAAIQNPGQCFNYTPAYNPFGHSGITYGVKDDVLYCRLPSGRSLAYHRPRLGPSDRWDGQLSISFEGYNTNPKNGPTGWITMWTYGGKLAENAIQATARDILRDGVIAADAKGYPGVLRVHDEVVAEVPKGFGSIEELEEILSTMPPWAAGWPIRAVGGYRNERYRKD